MRRVVVQTWVSLIILSSIAFLGCRSHSADEVRTSRRESAISNPPYLPFGGEYDELIATHSDKCLTVKDVSTSDGAEIVQWVCNGGENQRWQLRAHGGSYEIVAKHSGKCLTVLNASTADGALMIQWGCNQATHQLFGVESVGAGLKLTAVHSGKVVDVAGKSHLDGAGAAPIGRPKLSYETSAAHRAG